MRNPDSPVPPPLTTPLNWTDDETTVEKKRMHYRALIARVLIENPELRGTALDLKIGEASAAAPFKRDKQIWLEEVRRAEAILRIAAG